MIDHRYIWYIWYRFTIYIYIYINDHEGPYWKCSSASFRALLLLLLLLLLFLYIYIYVISKKTFGGRKRLGENGLNTEETTQSIRNGLTALCSDQWWFMFFPFDGTSSSNISRLCWSFLGRNSEATKKDLVLIFGWILGIPPQKRYERILLQINPILLIVNTPIAWSQICVNPLLNPRFLGVLNLLVPLHPHSVPINPTKSH